MILEGNNPSSKLWRYAALSALLTSAFFSPSCSTVKSKHNSSDVTEAGIESARELEEMASLLELPLAVVGGVATTSGELLKTGERYSRKGQNEDAAGSFLKAALESRELLIAQKKFPRSEAEKALLTLHNSSLARFAEVWGNDPRRSGPAPYHLNSGEDRFEIRLDPSSDFTANFFDEAISSDAVRGKGVKNISRFGLGAPLIGVRYHTPERAEEMANYMPKGLHMPITLTIASTGEIGEGAERRTLVSLAIHDPTKRDRVTIAGRSVPLAANFSAPILIMASGENEVLTGLFGFLNARKRAKDSGIYLLEPYDPDRIPILLSHGLVSAPIIWREIVPELMSEPDIAQNYQILAFRYPTSYAIAESAEFQRNQLKKLRERYDPEGDDSLSRNMVVAGHSMGGVLSNMLITDFDDRIWQEISDQRFDVVSADWPNKQAASDLLFFEYDKAALRAVFFSAPHRGANIATSGLAGALSQLAKLPSNVLFSMEDFIARGSSQGLKYQPKGKKMTSVQSLRPDSPILLAMDRSPHKSGVNYHSIIGDRGKGDTPDSSDGIVDYWSSHLDGADSELIVPTDHKSYRDPGAIEEFKRILRLHAGI